MKNTDQITLKEKLVSACSIPKDAGLGYPVVTMYGKKEVLIESYRGITEYNDVVIRVQTKAGQIKVSGKGLNVAYYSNDEMKIEGLISSIEYV